MTPGATLDLLRHARTPGELMTRVFAGVIAGSLAAGRRPLIRGLSENRFARLLNEYFPALEFANGIPPGARPTADAFDELLGLLLQHRAAPTEQRAWLSYAIASAAMTGGPLWMELGLAERAALAQLLQEHFPRLAGLDFGETMWKAYLAEEQCMRRPSPGSGWPDCAGCSYRPFCRGGRRQEAARPAAT